MAKFFFNWDSSSNTQAVISIKDENRALGGNDFALDDIWLYDASGCPPITVLPTALPPGMPNVYYEQIISATGGMAPYLYYISNGTLPPGLSIDQFSGKISGIPTTAGTFMFEVSAKDSNLCVGNRQYTLQIGSAGNLIADFTWSPPNPKLNENVQFTDLSIGNITSWYWDFGDGSSSNQQNPVHIYKNGGIYNVSLTVSDGVSQSYVSKKINVLEGNCLEIGGIIFCADSIKIGIEECELSGKVMIGYIIEYDGTLKVSNEKDEDGYYKIVGQGKLFLPDVQIPGVGNVILYDGSFSIPFDDGTFFEFLEEQTKLEIAGWKIGISELSFDENGIIIDGYFIIPQFVPNIESIKVSGKIKISKKKGIEILSGKLKIEKIQLAGGLSLKDVELSYKYDEDKFKGSATLLTPGFGIGMEAEVIKGCPNSISVTIRNVPIPIDGYPLKLVNYGLHANNFCGYEPFCIGLHSDLTFNFIPDANLLSASKLELNYCPLYTFNGGGNLKVMSMNIARAYFYLFDEYNDCGNGVCVRANLTLIPVEEQEWIVGDCDFNLLLAPPEISVYCNSNIQLPQSCWDLEYISDVLKLVVCPIISNYCRAKYPCVLASAELSGELIPNNSPEAEFLASFEVSSANLSIRATYNENNDKKFHFYFPADTEPNKMVTKVLRGNINEFLVFVPEGVPQAFFAIEGRGSYIPEFYLIDPNGNIINKNAPGVAYFEDIEKVGAVYVVKNPIAGEWKTIITDSSYSGNVISAFSNIRPNLEILDVEDKGSKVEIKWKVSGSQDCKVDLYYSKYKEPDKIKTGVIKKNISCSTTSVKTEWDKKDVMDGKYYIIGYAKNSKNGSIPAVYPEPIEIINNIEPEPPTNIIAQWKDISTIEIRWDKSASKKVAGYIVYFSQKTSEEPFENSLAVGNVSYFPLKGLKNNKSYKIAIASYDNNGKIGSKSKEVIVNAMGGINYLSVSASAKGSANTNWKTDLSILSKSETSSNLKFCYTLAGDKGIECNNTFSLNIPPKGYIFINDIVKEKFGMENTYGSLRIETDNPILITSRIYNYLDQFGTYGQFVKGACLGDAIYFNDLRGGKKAYAIGLKQNDFYRTNIGISEVNGIPTVVAIRIMSDGGLVISENILEVKEYSLLQISASELGVNNYEMGFYAEFEVLKGGAVLGYASVVDNVTGDAIYVPAISKDTIMGKSQIIPIIAKAKGAYNTNWQTNAWFLNPFDIQQTIILNYFKKEKIISFSFQLEPMQMKSMDDLIGNFLMESGDSFGIVEVLSQKGVVGALKIFNSGNQNGTYGQYVPLESFSELLEENEKAYILQLKNDSDFRSNIGISNFGNGDAKVLIKIYNPMSLENILGEKEFVVPKKSVLQINNIFNSLGIYGSYNTYAEVKVSSSGQVYAYASVVDNRTGDAIFIPAQR